MAIHQTASQPINLVSLSYCEVDPAVGLAHRHGVKISIVINVSVLMPAAPIRLIKCFHVLCWRVTLGKDKVVAFAF